MNALIRTALVGAALGVTAASAFAITPPVVGIDKNRPYCSTYDTLVRLLPNHKRAIVKNRCGQIRLVRCYDYYVKPFGIDSGYRNSCMVSYRVESPPIR